MRCFIRRTRLNRVITHYLAKTINCPIVGSMLGQRRRRWTNIEPTVCLLGNRSPTNLGTVLIFWIQGISHSSSFRPLCASLDKLIIDFLMDKRPGPPTADLSHVNHDGLMGDLHSRVHWKKGRPVNIHKCPIIIMATI